MTCRKCKGRGFYQVKDIESNNKQIQLCDHEPDGKYKRMFETLIRVNEYNPKSKEEK